MKQHRIQSPGSLSGFLLAVILGSLGARDASGQCNGWNFPVENKAAVEEKVALLQDAMKEKKYRQAIKPLNWLLEHAPNVNTSVYIHGAAIYDHLATQEKNPERKKHYVDSLMLVYDLREASCGEKAYVRARKALSGYKFYVNGSDAAKVLPLMDSAFAAAGADVAESLFVPYMQTIVVSHVKLKILSEDDVLRRYDRLVELIKAKILRSKSNQKELTRLNNDMKQVDEWLLRAIKPDCDFVKAKLGPKFKENPTDLVLAKRIFAYMLTGNCNKDPLWLEAAMAIYDQEKDFGLGKNIALTLIANEELDAADRYFQKVLTIAPTRNDSAEVYFYEGIIQAKKSNKPEARSFFLKSVRMDSERRDAYEQIGDLYFGSFKECAGEVSQAKDRSVYWAAYDCYERARNAKKMAQAKAQFPTREDVFVVDLKVGDKFHVGCWIDEEVIIRTRD